MTMVERLVKAIEEQGERINGVEYGSVLVRIQGGKVSVVEVSETFKPTPEHGRAEGYTHDIYGHNLSCLCGETFTGITPAHAMQLREAHIANSGKHKVTHTFAADAGDDIGETLNGCRVILDGREGVIRPYKPGVIGQGS